MSTDVLGYLQSKVLGPIRKAGGTEVHVPCFFHGEEANERGRLYVNVDPEAEIPGLFMCHRCGEKGALSSIKKHFGDVDEDPVVIQSDNAMRIWAEAASYYHERLGDFPDVYQWLKDERGLTIETIVAHEIGWADGAIYKHLRGQGFTTKDILATGLVVEDKGGRLVDSLQDMVTIPYHTAGNVVLIRGRSYDWEKGSGKPKYKTPAKQSSRVFNSAATWDADELIVTEGEFDALVLSQLGYRAIGVPGANTWQDTWDGYLAKARRVYLCFDQDEAGTQGRDKLVKRFGPKVRAVEMPVALDGEKKNDPTEWIVRKRHTKADFDGLLEEANRGGLLITVNEARREHAEVQGMSGLKFNIEQLDLMIDPGMLPGQVMVVLAKAGTGKTLFLLNVFERMAMVQPDLCFLFVSLEQTRGEWFERARRIHRFYNPSLSDDDVEKFWQDRLLIVDKNRLTEDELHSILDDFEYRMGRPPALTGIDYLGYWAQSFKGDRYERVSDAIMSLKSVGKDRRIPIITPHQVSRIAKYGEEPDADAARDAGVVEETADFLFTLWSQDHLLARAEDDKSGIVNLRIGKSRHGGRGTKISFQFAPLTLALVPHGADAVNGRSANAVLLEQARSELQYERIRDRWETAVRRHAGFLPSGAFAKALEDDYRRAEMLAPDEEAS